MTIEEKGKLIGQIITELKLSGRTFDEGDTFFALCFRTDAELEHIARVAGVKTGKGAK